MPFIFGGAMRFISSKSILGNNHQVNLYRGCTHNCIYCDSRSDVYHVGDFENIAVKENAITIFKQELEKKRHKFMIGTGSMCDPYLPLERSLHLTRQMLEVIYDHHFGVMLLSKSDLVLRDIDIIEKINHRFGALVCMTITTYDDDLCLQIERNVIPTSLRFACLDVFAKRNIPTGIWMGPILPFINDTEENITKIVLKCVEIGIKYIIVFEFGTTKRSGSEEYFYKSLDKYFPGIKDKYMKTYASNYNCISLNANKLWQLFRQLCDENNIVYELDKIIKYFDEKNPHKQLSLF